MALPLGYELGLVLGKLFERSRAPAPLLCTEVCTSETNTLKIPGLVTLCGLALASVTAFAQPDYALHASPAAPAPVDPAIVKALASIKAQSIQQTINSLVSFGTRSTLSSMETDLPAGQGINAAADWIAAQFETIARDCGGCLEVKRDT